MTARFVVFTVDAGDPLPVASVTFCAGSFNGSKDGMSLGAEVDSSTAPTVAVEAEIPSFLALVVSTCAGEGGGAGYLRSANVLRPKSCASLKFGRIEGLTTVADNVNLSMPLLSGGSHLLVTLSNTLLSDNCFSRAKSFISLLIVVNATKCLCSFITMPAL